MKKLILLLLFISLVSCDSTETKESIYSFGEDTWIIDWEFSNIPDGEINYKSGDYNFFEIQKNEQVVMGQINLVVDIIVTKDYFYSLGKSETLYFKDSEKTLLAVPYWQQLNEKNFPINIYKINWKSKDSIIGNLIEKDSSGVKLPFTNKKILLLRIPKYSSSEARDILIKKKNDLDLELITQKQYDSIKNKLSRYITD